MASHQLIADHLTELARRLPADVVDELADGLNETWQHHLATGLTPEAAARAAVSEFGSCEQITTAFTAHAPGRHTARVLLASGPIVGAWWGASLITTHAWSWPLPDLAPIAFAISLLAVVAALATAATSRHSYRRTRLGGIGGVGLLLLDATMLTTVALAASALVWPMAIAILASLTRIGWTLRALPTALAR